MYTRSYFPEDEKVSIPEKYNGNAFETHGVPDIQETESSEEVMGRAKKDDGIFGFLSHPLGALFPSLTKLGGDFHIGREELLIIGIALFLLFSKSGDKECAIMLLILLVFQ